MAQQYAGMPPYGASYPATPHQYAAYDPSATQPVPSPSGGYHQQHAQGLASQAPIMQANDLRFHANMQVTPQHAAFSFPSPMSADMLKRFPPPPPPPPPPAAFASGPGTPVNVVQMSHNIGNGYQPYPQHVYPNPLDVPALAPSAASQTPYPNSAVSFNSQMLRHDPRSHLEQSATSTQDLHNARELLQEPPVVGNHRMQSGSHHQASTSEIPTDMWQTNYQAVGHASQQASHFNKESAVSSHQPMPMTVAETGGTAALSPDEYNNSATSISYAELKEQAKVAILSLASHKITYDDLMTEGIDPKVLELLFSELGLEQGKRADTQLTQGTTEASSTNGIPQLQEAAKPAAPAPTDVVAGAAANGSPRAAQAIERKDRIAQLLAAKAAKSNLAGAGSPSPSLASASDAVVSRNPNAAGAGIVSGGLGNTQNLKKLDLPQDWSTNQLIQQQHATFEQAINPDTQFTAPRLPAMLNALPIATPVRESLIQNGLSTLIPGLFMGNDEDESENRGVPLSSNPATGDLEVLAQASDHVNAKVGQKRPASPSQVTSEGSRSSKRRASSLSGALDIEMEIEGSESGEASEGEIIESTKPLNNNQNSQRSQLQSEKALYDAGSAVTGQTYGREGRDALSMDGRPRATIASPSNMRKHGLPSPLAGATLPTQAGKSSNQSAVQDRPPNRSEASSTKPALAGQRPISKLTPAQLAERAAQLKADLVRQRQIRQQQLMEGVPALDEEVLKTQQRITQSKQRLDEVRAELQKYETEVARAREDEQQILIEIERLEKQLQQGVRGKRPLSEESGITTQQRTADNITAIVRPSSQASGHPSSSRPLDLAKPDASMHIEDDGTARSLIHEENQIDVSSSGVTAVGHINSEPQIGGEFVAVVSNNDGTMSSTDREPPMRDVQSLSITGVQPLEHQTVKTSSSSRNTPSTNESDRSIDQKQLNNVAASESGDSRMSIDDDSDADSDGSASMSDSGSDDYEPAEPNSDQETDLDLQNTLQRDESEEYNPEDTLATSNSTEDIANDYEPSENVNTETSGGTPTQTIDHMATNPGTSSAERLEQETRASVLEPMAGIQSAPNAQEANLNPTKSITTGGGLTQAANNGLSLDIEVVSHADGEKPFHFVPYQSPLSSFKSYRFHPSFTDQVQSGFRSLTYSNKIDPKTPICPSELAGEACTDPECQEQHFGSMVLTDDKILVQMSSAHDIGDKDLRDEFLLGLKQVIASLRQDGVKEFSQVAAALSKYRRDWSIKHSSI